MRRVLLAASALLIAVNCTGCIVAGYSSRGGAFIWPGGFGLILIIVLALVLLRRR